MNKQFEKLREEYQVFRYDGFYYSMNKNSLDIKYNFSIEGLSEFNPEWSFKITNFNDIDIKKLENLIFNLGLVELISYWKITCCKNVFINCHKLNDNQISFFKKLFFNGLGEFFYRNNIETTIDDFMDIKSFGSEYVVDDCVYEKANNKTKTLVTIGGGKDSIVALNLLKENVDVYPYVINMAGAKEETIIQANLLNKTILSSRTLDKRMLDLNNKDYLNGHTPFSAIVAFSSLIAGYLNGINFVALSNESSANEATIKGTNINHQYSKSFEFENDFNRYEKDYLKCGVYYFSFLRPLYEIQIADLFSRFKDYFKIFKSCNVGQKKNIWCASCPKCLFVFIILSIFIDKDTLVEIFGKDLLDDSNLINDFEKLCGIQEEKPFECVGQVDEVNYALKKLVNDTNESRYLLEHYKKKVKDLYYQDIYSNHYDDNNLLPEYFESILKEAINV